MAITADEDVKSKHIWWNYSEFQFMGITKNEMKLGFLRKMDWNRNNGTSAIAYHCAVTPSHNNLGEVASMMP